MSQPAADDTSPSPTPTTIRAAVLDTETTGLGPNNEVIEVAIAVVDVCATTGRIERLVETYQALREPAGSISAGAFAQHGISFSEVEGQEFDDATVSRILLGADVVIAHNVPFDRGVLRTLYDFAEHLPWRCSCWNVPWRSFGFPNGQLQSLLALHGIRPARAHRAGSDVESLVTLLGRTDPRDGQRYMWHLLNLGGRA